MVQDGVADKLQLIGTWYYGKKLPKISAEYKYLATERSRISREISQQTIHAIQSGQRNHRDLIPEKQGRAPQHLRAWRLRFDTGDGVMLWHIDRQTEKGMRSHASREQLCGDARDSAGEANLATPMHGMYQGFVQKGLA